jgi:hypothetical protein
MLVSGRVDVVCAATFSGSTFYSLPWQITSFTTTLQEALVK